MDNVCPSAELRASLEKAIQIAIAHRAALRVRERNFSQANAVSILQKLPNAGKTLSELLDIFQSGILPGCTNFASPAFMGFPDAGNQAGGLVGEILSVFLQQNLINQAVCAPSATFVEIAVLRWLWEAVGYANSSQVKNVWDCGGILTVGGTLSNTIAMMLAREQHMPGTMTKGVDVENSGYLIVPKGIGHYSVKSAQMWVGCGSRLIEAPTVDYRYDLEALEKILRSNKGKVMGLVAYAGDSRSMTFDRFAQIAELVNRIDPGIWLHADACHGFILGYSASLHHKIEGLHAFDSISLDPHKAFGVPYVVSALLVKKLDALKTVGAFSDLIMQEQFSLGQMSPFLGSKSWMALKLWFAMMNLGAEGIGALVDQRHFLACTFYQMLKERRDFLPLHIPDYHAVMFLYAPKNWQNASYIPKLNAINTAIYKQMMLEGQWHVHNFSIPDRGVLCEGAMLKPLRVMSGNEKVEEAHFSQLLDYVEEIAVKLKLQNIPDES